MSTPPPDLSRSTALVAFAVSVLAILGGALVFATVLRGHGQRPAPGPNLEAQATHACQDFVRDQLAEPTTSSFAMVVTSPAVDAWTVTGTVESQGATGTPVRQAFTCRTHTDGRGQWYDDGTKLADQG